MAISEREELQERELVQDIGLDGLLEFCAGDRGLQNLGEQLAERGMFGRAGVLAVFAVEEGDIDRSGGSDPGGISG